jgi:hypothetical protein
MSAIDDGKREDNTEVYDDSRSRQDLGRGMATVV